MEPITIAIAAAVAAFIKHRRDERLDEEDTHNNFLLFWDEALRPYDGCPGERVSWPRELVAALTFLQNGECNYESSDCRGALTVDHRTSLDDGGNNYSDNLHMLCKRHNSSKRERSVLEFEYDVRRSRRRR